jgi:hypothetical protein
MNQDKLKELAGGLDLQTDLWWLAMMLVGFLASFLAAFTEGGVFWAYLSVFVRLAFAAGLSQQPWGTIFARLVALGLVAGGFEIFADYMTVVWQKGQRGYQSAAALLLSPLYVPLLWACSIVEFGYAIVRIYSLVVKRLSVEAAMGTTMFAGGFLAAVWTACTDFWAVKAGWWEYGPGEAIMGERTLALYVVMAHFFTFILFLPVFSRYVACPGTRLYAALRYGMVFGGIIFFSFFLSHLMVERSL